MRNKIIIAILIFFFFCSPVAGAESGTVPEPVLPLGFHDIAFTPSGDAVSVQLGLSDWDQGVVTAALTFKNSGTAEIATLTYATTDAIYSTTNTTWLTQDLRVGAGTWELRQVYAKDGAGRELNLFFMGGGYNFTVPDAPLPIYILYLSTIEG